MKNTKKFNSKHVVKSTAVITAIVALLCGSAFAESNVNKSDDSNASIVKSTSSQSDANQFFNAWLPGDSEFHMQ